MEEITEWFDQEGRFFNDELKEEFIKEAFGNDYNVLLDEISIQNDEAWFMDLDSYSEKLFNFAVNKVITVLESFKEVNKKC